MKYLVLVLLAFALTSHAGAQQSEEVLATSTGTSYRPSSLSPEAQKLYAERRNVLADARTRLLSDMIVELLLDFESKVRSSTPDKLLVAERGKVAPPTTAEIEAVYNANRNKLGGRPLDEVRPQIIEFLKHDSEDKVVDAFIQSLRAKHKGTMG